MSIAGYAHADPLDSSINSLPIFSGMVSDSKYKAAANKAQEAFFIQTGVTQSVDQTKVVITKAATEQATKAIEDNTPMKAKDVFFVAGTAYALGVKKQVVTKFKNPIIPGVTNVMMVGKDSGSLMFNLPF